VALDQRKYERRHLDVLRDIRPLYVRFFDWTRKPSNSFAIFTLGAFAILYSDAVLMAADFIFVCYCIFFLWLTVQDRSLAFKMPTGSKWKDKRNMGAGKKGQPEGILYLGNVKDTKEEVWFSNSDARTHILYLGTTGSGKTEGLKSMVTNALAWGSGFVYIDGKADTDLWSSLSSLVRRFGRDDDLLVLNYMTGNSDVRAPSNTMNPFSSGSASYLTQMLVSMMPDAEGDNAMWKERAVSLVASIMPALTWKRDNQDIPMSIGTIRHYLTLNNVVRLSRDKVIPEDIRAGIKGYLETLPGYIDAAFDDEGKEKPPGPDQPAYDTTTPRQQHGYLSMQFTRALQSLGDEYGYIFDTQAADVDMIDVVLNRRILVVLIPALEKSSDETANLGKIVAATIKGMMGSTLGATVEGESATVIENKPTQSATPFMVVFDEVGYYTAPGMAVMAAQARSLGFCLIFSAQDLPALEKRVKEESRSITANCNIKIFGKLEDPTQTKEFFEKTVGTAFVMESSGYQLTGGRSTGSYYDTMQAGLQLRPRASYDGLRAFKEGEAVIAFGEMVVDTQVFYSNPGFAKAMRVTRYMALPPPDENIIKHADAISKVRDRLVHKTWTAMKADVAIKTPDEITEIIRTYAAARKAALAPIESGMAAIASIHAMHSPADLEEAGTIQQGGGDAAVPAPAAVAAPPVVSAPAAPPAVPAAPAEPAGSGGPMSFFGKKKSGGDVAVASPPAPVSPPATPEAKGPVNWQDLVNMSEPDGGVTDLPRAALPPEAEESLKNAGKNIRDILFRSRSDDDKTKS
jgi:intracellular multiplication protein IcmO